MTVAGWIGRAAALMVLAGCGTVVRGSDQDVTITTEPAGAEVILSDGQRCTSPCTLEVERHRVLKITARKPGCTTAREQLVPRVPEGGSWWLSVMDYQLGGAYSLDPNPLNLELICGAAAENRTRMLGLTAEDEAVMASFGKAYENQSETPPAIPAGRLTAPTRP